MKQMKVLLGLSLAAVIAAQPAQADSKATAVNSSTSSSSSSFENFIKHARASYIFEVNGAKVAAPSGNVSGAGTDLQIIHYLSMGYRVGGKWSVNVTQPLIQNINEVAEGTPGASRAFDAADPYVSFNNSRIMGSNYLSANLSGQLRYYVPVSRGTVNAANDAKATESGNGRIRANLTPSIALMDGALEISTPMFFYMQFARRSDAERQAKNGSASRRDIRVYPAAIAAYQTTKNVQAYLEAGALFNHTTHKTADSWSKVDDASDGLYLAPGAYIAIGKKLSLNPAVYFGPFAFAPKKASLYLAATYVFL
jgi:hypothetical protein